MKFALPVLLPLLALLALLAREPAPKETPWLPAHRVVFADFSSLQKNGLRVDLKRSPINVQHHNSARLRKIALNRHSRAIYRLFCRRFTPAGFDLPAKVRKQPTRNGLRAVRRV
jgi:hypothetical protein